ncbi:MAG: HD domain-containing protein [Anaerolineaceae bacterium]|nr:HD domain-containing protein [Anaerolineaceae bacterium]
MTSSVPEKAKIQAGASVQLLYALNNVATTLQQSIQNERNVYTVFQREVIGLGLRGGISELDETGQYLQFKVIAHTNPIRKILTSYEKQARLKAVGYTVRVDSVDVYYRVIHEGLATFVADTSKVSSQVIPHQLRGLIKPILSFLGSPPGIFAPLIFDGKVKGMLNMVGPNLTEADLPTLQAFANQIAVALENARLITSLQNANQALENAYQKAMEGWVMALDLRDQEIEGHSMRVAYAAGNLAESMGMDAEELHCLNIGALMHDIGKMSIPDSILYKPGPLTDAEWEIMRQHPQNACAWMEAIDYMRPALDIPYCHHERWDGSGYPQGLVGEEIPLAARIFAVVDAWDAMSSDRPYRKALQPDEVIAQIKAESGSHFDPKVVDAFLNLIMNDPALLEMENPAS